MSPNPRKSQAKVGPAILARRTRVRFGLKVVIRSDQLISLIHPKACSEMNHAATGRLSDRICTPDRIELVDQSTNMKLRGMDGYAKTASNRLV
jgi:hypothetical protein